MAKKPRGKRPRMYRTSSKQAVHEQMARRREVAKYRAMNYTAAEIAHKIGASVPTVLKDFRILEEQWWEHAQKDTGKLIADEVAKLESTRAEVLRCFYEAKNRHGEGHQASYIAQYARITERIHALLRLTEDRHSAQQGVMVLQAVPMVVRNREEAERFAPGGQPNLEAIRELLATRN